MNRLDCWWRCARLAMRALVPALLLASCMHLPTPEQADQAVLSLRDYGNWAWAAGIILIWVDIVLPVPQTVVIAGLGIIYGGLIGGLVGSIGLVSGGLLGYLLMRTSARHFLRRVVRARSVHGLERMFDRAGAWAIVLSRSLPYSVPEAIVLLAGLARMPLRTFTASLAIGSAPTAFVFAAVGAGWADHPTLALGVSYVVPILLLPAVLYILRRRAS